MCSYYSFTANFEATTGGKLKEWERSGRPKGCQRQVRPNKAIPPLFGKTRKALYRGDGFLSFFPFPLLPSCFFCLLCPFRVMVTVWFLDR